MKFWRRIAVTCFIVVGIKCVYVFFVWEIVNGCMQMRVYARTQTNMAILHNMGYLWKEINEKVLLYNNNTFSVRTEFV